MKLLLLLLPIIGFAQVLRLPNQTTATRATCPSPFGCIAFNSETKLFEGQNGTSWTSLGSGGGTTTIVEDILTSTSATHALSANQGRVLDEKILPLQTSSHAHANKTLLDSLTTAGAATQFLAADGTYKTPIDTNSVTIVLDVLTSTSITSALSANQGKVLNDKITPLTTTSHAHANKTLLDSLISNGSATQFLSADGTYKTPIDTDTDTITLVEDILTSTSAVNALSANQGRILNNKILAIPAPASPTVVEDVLTSSSATNALSANQGKVLKGLTDTNTTNIASNTSAIATNTTNITTNTNNIATNTSAIATNTSNISTNAAAIATNTTNISTLQTSSHSHANKATLDVIKNTGTATEFLAGDGTYKVPVDTSTTIPTCTGSQRLTGNGTTLVCVDNNFANLGTIAAAGTATCNVSTTHICYYTAAGNHTVAFAGTPVLGMMFQVIATSTTAYTISWPAMKWPAGTPITTTKANAHSVFTIVYSPGGYLVVGVEDLR